MKKIYTPRRYVSCLVRSSIGGNMSNILSILDLQGITWLAGVCVVIITTLVQNLRKINNIEERDLEQDRKSEEERVKAARRRILRCADEIRSKVRHSKEFFDDILADISFYKRYCKENPKFENEKAVMAIELIEETYKKCCRENDFL